MSSILHQRQQQQPLMGASPTFQSPIGHPRSLALFSRTGLLVMLALMVVLGVLFPWTGLPESLFSSSESSLLRWRDYTLAEAASFVAKNGTIIVCAVSQPYLPFLNNWLISISSQKHQEMVLVIAEDYTTLYKVNQKWPGHAVLVPPAPDAQTAHKFGSQMPALLILPILHRPLVPQLHISCAAPPELLDHLSGSTT